MTPVFSFHFVVFGIAGAVSVPTSVAEGGRGSRDVVVGVKEVMPVVTVQSRNGSSAVTQLIWHAFRVRRVLATIAR